MGKLDAKGVDEYFEKHLPYRIGALLAHDRMTWDGNTQKTYNGDPGQLTACFIASLVTARLFLNVMGVGKSSGAIAPYVGNPVTDVNALDLNGKYVDLTKLGPDEGLFLNFIIMADKAAAHFTMPETHDWSKTHEVIGRVCHYLKSQIFDPAGKTSVDLDAYLASITG